MTRWSTTLISHFDATRNCQTNIANKKLAKKRNFHEKRLVPTKKGRSLVWWEHCHWVPYSWEKEKVLVPTKTGRRFDENNVIEFHIHSFHEKKEKVLVPTKKRRLSLMRTIYQHFREGSTQPVQWGSILEKYIYSPCSKMLKDAQRCSKIVIIIIGRSNNTTLKRRQHSAC